jgi:hypothetical protein
MMLTQLPAKLEDGRVISGYFGSKSDSGPFGAFFVQGPCGTRLKIIASGAHKISEGWEHVSVSCEKRCPNWIEMCFVKDLFWAPEECAIQFHPPKSEYVNCHPYCLHIWKPPFEMPLPQSILVGPQMSNRDERGWRIPRKGTKSAQIYDMLLAGFSTTEIINQFCEVGTIRVLIHNIKNPEKHNKRARDWRGNNPGKAKASSISNHTKRHGAYSKYVMKLVKVLDISYTEAVALERKELEKMK